MWRFYEHLHKTYLHIRERFSLRRIFHIHGIVLGLAWWKILLSHVGITFLIGKYTLIQIALIKTVIWVSLFSLFPLAHDVTLAANELQPIGYEQALWDDNNVENIVNEIDTKGATTNPNEENTEDGNAVKNNKSSGANVETPSKSPIIDLYPALLDAFNTSLKSFQEACSSQENKTEFLSDLADTSAKDGGIDPLHVLASYCITDHYDATRYGILHSNTVTSKADAIKMLAKTLSLGSDTTFDEGGIYLGKMPYDDIFHDGRYIDYVVYLEKIGVLGWVGTKNIQGEKKLDVLMPISKHEVKTMLKNLGITNNFSILSEPGSYVYRDEFAQIMIDAFPEKFVDYKYMRGGNAEFYKKFLGQLEGKKPATQWMLLQLLSEKLHKTDSSALIAQQNLYVDGVNEFLKLAVKKALQ